MAEKEACMIGPSVTISGNVSGTEDLVVQGRIEGRISLEGSKVVVDGPGRVEADVDAGEVEIYGGVKGDVSARSASLSAGARIIGTLRAEAVSIEEGAQVSGAIEMQVDLPEGVSA